MNRKVMKIASILLMIAMVVTMLSTSAFATTDYLNPSQFGGDGGYKSNDTATTDVFGNFIATCINIIQVVGMGVAIIMLVVMAIKYITAAPSEKAELKKSITIYVVGAIVLFSASAILGIIKNFATVNIQVQNTVNNNGENGYVEVIDMDTMYLG